MITFDLKGGYHHVEIHPDHLTFLGFAWKFPKEASIRYFVFSVLPFGLSSAPYIFIKCLKPLEKYWRFNGVSIALFLDDGWLIDSDRDTCTTLAASIWSDLGRQGLSPMMRSLNGVRVKFVNGWELYGTPLMGLLLFLSDGKTVLQ